MNSFHPLKNVSLPFDRVNTFFMNFVFLGGYSHKVINDDIQWLEERQGRNLTGTGNTTLHL